MRNGYRYYIESPMQKCFRRLNTKIALFLLLLTITVLSMPSSVFAAQYRRVNVMVAYDEEWESTAFWLYGYSAKTLANVIVASIYYRFYAQFQIRFRPVSYQFWDSHDNPANKDVMMDEVISETGFETGMTIGYDQIDVLIAFTDQEIPSPENCHGYSDKILGVVLVRHSYPDGVGQATDNVLQHELSHLYDVPEEYVEDSDCVMNWVYQWIDFPFYYNVRTFLLTTNWCEDCLGIISSNADKWGRLVSGGGGGGEDLLYLY